MAKPPLAERPVTYGAVGASSAPDLLRYPPRRFRPFEQRARIGFGDERWEFAWSELMTWGVQRRMGFDVQRVARPADAVYEPVGFDAEAVPVRPALLTVPAAAVDHDDAQFLRPGETVVIGIRLGPFTVQAPARVIYVVDETDRRGFAYGTLPGHPESGEEAFLLEREADGSVWFTTRGFSHPGGFVWWLVQPVLALVARSYQKRYARTLAGRIAPR